MPRPRQIPARRAESAGGRLGTGARAGRRRGLRGGSGASAEPVPTTRCGQHRPAGHHRQRRHSGDRAVPHRSHCRYRIAEGLSGAAVPEQVRPRPGRGAVRYLSPFRHTGAASQRRNRGGHGCASYRNSWQAECLYREFWRGKVQHPEYPAAGADAAGGRGQQGAGPWTPYHPPCGDVLAGRRHMGH